jgi:hypothetical protein
MNPRTLKNQAWPALLAGTGRQPLSLRGGLEELAGGDPAVAALNALSLTGQALRFERPAPPPSFAVEPEIRDQRPLTPDALRRPLLRLLNGKRPSDDLALALAWAFAEHKIRPHPFDMPRMEAFARAHAAHLGLAAQHWAAQQGDAIAEPRGFFDADDLDELTWSNAQPARRARFIAERRRQDPAAARTLVEAVWPQESAEARLRLLTALEPGLGPGDQPFLESLGKDRAPRVRALALRFLARMPGQSGDHPALKAALERIRRSTAGLLRKRQTLALELPVTVKEQEAKTWIRETFAEVGCAELAHALALTETEMVEGAEKDENLSLALAWMATQDNRFDLLDQLAKAQLPNAWELMSQGGNADLSLMTPEKRQQWAAILIQPCAKSLPANYLTWIWLHRTLEGPAPGLLIESTLRSPRWLAQLLEANQLVAEWLELLAALCAPSHSGRLRAHLAELDLPAAHSALALLEILESLKKVGHDEPSTAK